MSKSTPQKPLAVTSGYTDVKSGIVDLLHAARQAAARNLEQMLQFYLTWSTYVRLLSLKDEQASQFYERTALSKNNAAMLTKGAVAKPEDTMSPDEAVKNPYLLDGLPNKIMAANYNKVLPDAEVLQKELEKTRLMLKNSRATLVNKSKRKA